MLKLFPWFALCAATLILGFALGRSTYFRKGRLRFKPTREQLLSWIDQAPVGWIILDSQNRVRFYNGNNWKFLIELNLKGI